MTSFFSQPDDIYFFALTVFAPIIGLLIFLSLLMRHGFAHLRGLREAVAFFFAPFGPNIMLVVKGIDNSVTVLYDSDIEIYKTSKGLVVNTGDLQYVTTYSIERFPLVSLGDARAPPGIPSPFGVAWRVILGWGSCWTAGFIGMEFTFLEDLLLGYIPSPASWISLMLCILYAVLLFAYVLPRIYTPTIRLAGFVEGGISENFVILKPSCSPWDDTSVDECVEAWGGKIEILLTRKVEEALSKLVREGKSPTLAAAILNKLVRYEDLKKSIRLLRLETLSIQEAAREHIAASPWTYLRRVTFSKLIVWAFFFGLGVIAGFVFGSSWAVSPVPPYNESSAVTAAMVTPAQPPPPPMPTQTPTVTPAPPPTITTKNVTITPAPPPPPPTNTTTPS